MNGEYPDEDELKRIREWDWHDLPGMFAFVKSIWWMASWGFHQDGQKFSISTGGWSGNEEIIDAMQENAMAWGICWQSSKRGGHYEFELPTWAIKAQPPTEPTE